MANAATDTVEVPAVTYAFPIEGTIAAKSSSPFGAARGNAGRHHAGNDFQAENGSDAVAVIGGQVLYTGHNAGYQWNAVVLGDDGNAYRYATHGPLSVKQGDRVEQGGKVGTIARSHLHFEVIPPSSPAFKQMKSHPGEFVKTQWWGNKQPLTIDPMEFFGLKAGTRMAAGERFSPDGIAGTRPNLPADDYYDDGLPIDLADASIPNIAKMGGAAAVARRGSDAPSIRAAGGERFLDSLKGSTAPSLRSAGGERMLDATPARIGSMAPSIRAAGGERGLDAEYQGAVPNVAEMGGAAKAKATVYPTLMAGAKNDPAQVRQLQENLNRLGANINVTGKYDDATKHAVTASQIVNNLTKVDGIAGPETLSTVSKQIQQITGLERSPEARPSIRDMGDENIAARDARVAQLDRRGDETYQPMAIEDRVRDAMRNAGHTDAEIDAMPDFQRERESRMWNDFFSRSERSNNAGKADWRSSAIDRRNEETAPPPAPKQVNFDAANIDPDVAGRWQPWDTNESHNARTGLQRGLNSAAERYRDAALDLNPVAPRTVEASVPVIGRMGGAAAVARPSIRDEGVSPGIAPQGPSLRAAERSLQPSAREAVESAGRQDAYRDIDQREHTPAPQPNFDAAAPGIKDGPFQQAAEAARTRMAAPQGPSLRAAEYMASQNKPAEASPSKGQGVISDFLRGFNLDGAAKPMNYSPDRVSPDMMVGTKAKAPAPVVPASIKQGGSLRAAEYMAANKPKSFLENLMANLNQAGANISRQVGGAAQQHITQWMGGGTPMISSYQAHNLPSGVTSASNGYNAGGDNVRSYVMNGVEHVTMDRGGTSYMVK